MYRTKERQTYELVDEDISQTDLLAGRIEQKQDRRMSRSIRTKARLTYEPVDEDKSKTDL